MNDCDRYQEMICCLIDGELTSDERKVLMAHIALCPECKATYEAFSAVSVAVASDLVDVPESLHENIMSGVRRRALFHKNKRSASRRVKGLIAAAACFAVVLFSAVGIFDTLLSRDASVADEASPAAAQSFDEFGNAPAPKVIPASPSGSPSASASVPLPSVAPSAVSSAPGQPDEYGGGAPAATERPMPTQPPVQTQKPTQNQPPVQTLKPVQTPAPVQTQAPMQTPAPVQTPEPVLPPAQAYTVDNDSSGGSVPAPQSESVDDPALYAEPSATIPDQGKLTVQSVEPSGAVGTPAPVENAPPAETLTPASCPPKRALKYSAAPAAEAPAAVEAQGVEAEPSGSEPSAITDAPAVSEEGSDSFTDKILRSFKSMFGISEPSATHAPEKLSEDDVDVTVDLTDMEDYKPFSDLLLGKLSELPEGNADRVYLFLMKNGDMEIKLLAYAYGDEIYYTIHDELVQQNIYLADCTLDELEKFILPYLPAETAAPANGSTAANNTGVAAPVQSAAPTQVPDVSAIIPADPNCEPGLS